MQGPTQDIDDQLNERPEQDDPYMGDENTYQEHFRKTFITENQKEGEAKEVWTLHDMLIPAGNTAKLVRIPDPLDQDFRISEVCDRLKFTQPTPVIMLVGAMTQRAGKTLAGVARAAFRTDAIIIDSGLGSGIEKFCSRKSVPLLGIAPEGEVIYPRINPNVKKDNELTNGHTHFVLIGESAPEPTPKGQTKAITNKPSAPTHCWGDEAALKFDLAKRIAEGRSRKGGTTSCKIVTVVVGDSLVCHKDIKKSQELGIPVVVLAGSVLSNAVIAYGEDPSQSNQGSQLAPVQQESLKLLTAEKTIKCPDSSEDLASVVHLLLTVSF